VTEISLLNKLAQNSVTHPPIPPLPPNCGHFREQYFLLSCGETICLLGTARWRPIIAAVARCAWLDEAQALDVTHKHAFSEMRAFPTIHRDEHAKYVAAIANAKAWAKWGKSA
jgi:hypothetical protein